MDVKIHLSSRWSREDTARSCGYGFYLDRLLTGEDLASHFISSSPQELCDRLYGTNGSFACVTKLGKTVAFAVDRIRSWPLFYSIEGQQLFVSDDAHWVAAQVGVHGPTETVLAEFLLAGYVTGQETLHPQVWQVQAGEAVFVEPSDTRLLLRTHRYYRYLNSAPRSGRDEGELMAEWDQVLVDCFTRLIRSAAGRPLVVPLSGGYDSRLICLMLQRLEYPNVIAFSYGAIGNREAVVSQQVAQRLDLPWYFVEYTNQHWAEWSQTPEYREYTRFAGALTSVAHVQDWPAVWELKRRGLIPQDSIFVPGHAADFVAGSHIPPEWANRNRVGEERLIRQVRAQHYSLWPVEALARLKTWTQALTWLDSEISSRIRDHVAVLDTESSTDAASAFEYWDWQERQAKFIANSVRVYDFWGYEWRLPFWDSAVMDFWAKVPLNHRLGKALYDTFFEQAQGELGELDVRKGVGQWLRKVLQRPGLRQLNVMVRHLWQWSRARSWTREYENHPLRWYGMVPQEVFRRYYRGGEDINSFLSLAQSTTVACKAPKSK